MGTWVSHPTGLQRMQSQNSQRVSICLGYVLLYSREEDIGLGLERDYCTRNSDN